MLFSSFSFLFFFLPVVVLVYYTLPRCFRNGFLLLSSLLFYAFGEPRYIALMIGIIGLNYAGALAINLCPKPKIKKGILSATIVANIGLLGFFKYTSFFMENLSFVRGMDIPFMEIILPIGISFYVFQSLSYVLDVYWNRVPVQKSFAQLALYISFFPQLVAGPIVKYHDIYEQLKNRIHSFDGFIWGLKRFIMGLGKKVLIANVLGETVDKIFDLPVNDLSLTVAWTGAVFYTLQLYFDFSGYSDMAIGLGRMFGFKFLENFNYPYMAQSVREFWTRWHISLSTWFKEYLYIPLGGNRVGKLRTYLNLALVFFLTGLWHGASWTFVIWGMWHGLFIILERMASGLKVKIPTSLRHGYLLLIAIVGWVIFRSPDLGYAVRYLGVMFNAVSTNPSFGGLYYSSTLSWIVFAIAVISATGLFKKTLLSSSNGWGVLVSNVFLINMFALSLIFLMGASYNPFIYFRF